jgi:arylsulfatase A-like enzyme
MPILSVFLTIFYRSGSMDHSAKSSPLKALVLGALCTIAFALLIADIAVVSRPGVADHLGLVLLLGVFLPAAVGVAFGAGVHFLARLIGRTGTPSKRLLSLGVGCVLLLSLPLLVAPFLAEELPAPEPGSADHPRVVLLGIDGATWDRMDSLIAAGEMPNIAHLLRTGTRGILESELPAFSPIVWTTIAAGKSPDIHGVSGASETARHVGCLRIWDILRREGYSTGTFGYLITWPPLRAQNGFTVPGWTAHGPEAEPEEYGFVNRLRFTFSGSAIPSPLELFRIYRDWARAGGRFSTIARSLGRFVKAGAIIPSKEDFFYLSREALLDIKTDAFAHLVRSRPTDFTAYYIDTVDNESHLYWRWLEPEKFENVDPRQTACYQDVIPMTYRHADEAVGRALEAIGPYDLLLLVSDHGFEAGNRNQFTINIKALMQAIQMPADAVRDYVIIYPRFYVKPASPEAANEIIARIGRLTESQTGIPFFVARIVESGDVEIGVNNSQMVKEVKARGETAQDMANATLLFDGQSIPVRKLVDLASRAFSGAHNLDGIIIAQGKNVKQGAAIGRSSIYDVVPTLLAGLHMPLADDMPGRPLVEIYEDAFLAQYPLAHTPTYEREGERPGSGIDPEENDMPDALKEHLRSLGYIN